MLGSEFQEKLASMKPILSTRPQLETLSGNDWAAVKETQGHLELLLRFIVIEGLHSFLRSRRALTIIDWRSRFSHLRRLRFKCFKTFGCAAFVI